MLKITKEIIHKLIEIIVTVVDAVMDFITNLKKEG